MPKEPKNTCDVCGAVPGFLVVLAGNKHGEIICLCVGCKKKWLLTGNIEMLRKCLCKE